MENIGRKGKRLVVEGFSGRRSRTYSLSNGLVAVCDTCSL